MGCCECVASHPKTDMNATQLAVLFAPCLIRKGPNRFDIDDLSGCIQFVIFMISDFNITFKTITEDRIKTQDDTKRITELYRIFTGQPEIQAVHVHRSRTSISGPIKRGEAAVPKLPKGILSAEIGKRTSQSSGFVKRKPRNSKSPRNFIQSHLSESVPSLITDAPVLNLSPSPKAGSQPSSPSIGKLCPACSQLVTLGINALGKTWHEKCFVCTSCKSNFLNGKFLECQGKPYCISCLNSKKVCARCKETITDGIFVKAGDKFWHRDHFICSKCGTLLSNGFYPENDMCLCSNCVAKIHK